MKFLLLALFFLLPACLWSQQAQHDTRFGYGISGHFNFNYHIADFRGLPGVPSCTRLDGKCPPFEGGTGTGATFGMLYNFPVSKKIFISARTNYSMQGATLRVLEETAVRDQSRDEAVKGEFEHSLRTTISSFGLEPLVGFSLFRDFTLYGGVRLGATYAKTFYQKEEIIKPSDFGVFLNSGSRVQNEYSGDIPGANGFNAAVLVGAGYDLPVTASGSVIASPEIFVAYSLTPVISEYAWNIASLRAGLSLRYIPKNDPPPVVAVEPAPVAPHVPLLSGTVLAQAVDADGNELPAAQLRIEEFISTRMHPLLNYVFFDENSSELPARYTRMPEEAIASFNPDRLFDRNTLEIYHHMLNIIGSRLREHPAATITLTGCNNSEAGGKDLSRSRAGVVSEYLATVWNIDRNRIKTELRNLPQKYSNLSEPEGAEENRRVEISSDEWKILEPVIIHDTLHLATPPTVKFFSQVYAEAGIGEWNLKIMQGDRLIKEFSGDSMPQGQILWNINEEKIILDKSSTEVRFALSIRDTAGQVFRTEEQSLPLESLTIQKKRTEKIADREIDRYNLILFDFDKADLSSANQKIADFIKGRLRSNSFVTITGYTDRLGDESYNQKLSENRAVTSAKILDVPSDRVKGMGESQLLYDNSLPEGRFYCRTVGIIVETPVQQPEQ